jgi:hypothetical protein
MLKLFTCGMGLIKGEPIPHRVRLNGTEKGSVSLVAWTGARKIFAIVIMCGISI